MEKDYLNTFLPTLCVILLSRYGKILKNWVKLIKNDKWIKIIQEIFKFECIDILWQFFFWILGKNYL